MCVCELDLCLFVTSYMCELDEGAKEKVFQMDKPRQKGENSPQNLGGRRDPPPFLRLGSPIASVNFFMHHSAICSSCLWLFLCRIVLNGMKFHGSKFGKQSRFVSPPIEKSR